MKLTILTPTYNRGDLLLKLYDSLLKQDNFDFEWLVIDDGSVDRTELIVNRLSSDKFPIVYKKKTNGGKHTALNYSHDYINGEFVMILDSDDIVPDNIMGVIMRYIDKFYENQSIGCLSFERGNVNFETLANKSVSNDFISNAIDYRINKNVKGDQAEIFRSTAFKQYKFPVFPDEKYLGEDYLHINLAYNYDTVYINKIIRISDYRSDGLTAAGRKMLIKNPLGGMIHGQLYVSKRFNIKYRVKGMMLYICYGLFAQKSIYELYRSVQYRLLFFCCLPFGILLYVYWSIKYK